MLTGCHPTKCLPLPGYECNPTTNTCAPSCGDDAVNAPEECDNGFGRDLWIGCNSTTCRALEGYRCVKNVCEPICGDGLVIGPEECDHGGNRTKMLNGCNAITCNHTQGFACSSCRIGVQCPNKDCEPVCGDGVVFAPEECDSVDGCFQCRALPGYTCDNNLCTPV
jgi:cysteine-rich repeat protein